MISVTIIMPCLNVASYVKKSIDSVILQTIFANLEIMIIDAGSTDGTYEIASWYEQKYENVHLIRSEKKSYGYQVNQGIKNAHGKYVAIVETDDYVRNDMYEKLYYIAEEQQADFVKADYTNFYECRNGKIIEWDTLMMKDKNMYDKLIDTRKNEFVHKHDFSIWKGIYNRKFLLDNDIFLNETSGAAYQDIGFGQLLHSTAKHAYYIADCLYQYRHGREGSSVNSGRGIIYAYGEFRRLLELSKTRYICLAGLYEAMLSSFLGEFSLVTDIYGLKNDLKMIEAMEWMISHIDEALSKGLIQKGNFRTEEIGLFYRIKENFLVVASEMIEAKNKASMKYLVMQSDGFQHIIFGAGNYGKRALMQLDKHGVRVDMFWDNDSTKRDVAGIPVNQPNISMLQEETRIIIANKCHFDEIKLQLREMGVKEEQITVYIEDYLS